MRKDRSDMAGRLKKFYGALIAPAVLGFLLAVSIRPSVPVAALSEDLAAILAPATFLLAALFAVAGPILYRSVFAHRRRHLSQTPSGQLLNFERNLIAMSMVAPYLALVATWLQLPRFHVAGTLLMALYAVYTAYPSQRRLLLDRQIFRSRDAPAGGRTKP